MKKVILIIDDETRIREIYQKLFHAVGQTVFDVILASDLEGIFDCLKNRPVDLVLLDIRMPHIDAREIAAMIRDFNPRIKVVVASVYPIDKQKRIIPEAEEYYDKSEGPLKLLETVTSVLT